MSSTISLRKTGILVPSCHTTLPRRMLSSSAVDGPQPHFSKILIPPSITSRSSVLGISSSSLLSYRALRLVHLPAILFYNVSCRSAFPTWSSRAIQAIRYLTRHKERKISVIEAEAKSVDVCIHHPSCYCHPHQGYSPSRKLSRLQVRGVLCSPTDMHRLIIVMQMKQKFRARFPQPLYHLITSSMRSVRRPKLSGFLVSRSTPAS